MKYKLLKALAKKQNFLKKVKTLNDSSDDSLSSDNEEEISKDILFKLLNNRYIILKYLGRGTFCRTWFCYDSLEDINVAIKIFFKEFYEDSFNELEINKKIINNSHIVKLLDNFVIDKQPHLVYELMGITLFDIKKIYENKNEHIPVNLIKNILKQVFIGLNDLHKNNIIHLDLKTENIMIKQHSNNMINFIDKLETLGLKEKLLNFIEDNLPENYSDLNKSKKKTIKRKKKIKSLKMLIEYIKENIEEIEKLENDIEIDNNNLICKIIDLGNSEVIGDNFEDEIMIRNYRPPENIMNNYYDEKADIWSVGCIIYELFTDEYLFEIDENIPKIEKDHAFLFEMYKILGKIPKELTLNCEFSENLFDNQGRIKNIMNYESLDLQKKLEQYISLESALELSKFLRTILDYDIKKRPSALELIDSEWLKFD